MIVPIKGFKSYTEMTCHVTILASEKARSSQSGVMLDWVDSGIVPSVEKAEFVPASAEPVWNQSFKMLVYQHNKLL